MEGFLFTYELECNHPYLHCCTLADYVAKILSYHTSLVSTLYTEC